MCMVVFVDTSQKALSKTYPYKYIPVLDQVFFFNNKKIIWDAFHTAQASGGPDGPIFADPSAIWPDCAKMIVL